MTGPVADVPVGRYGPAPRRGARRRRAMTLWLLGLAGLAMALWIGLGAARTPVNWQDVGFRIDGAESVEVVFEVSRIDPSVPVECRLQALNQQHAQVGVRTVALRASTQTVHRLSAVVATSEEAVTGVVDRCWVVEAP